MRKLTTPIRTTLVLAGLLLGGTAFAQQGIGTNNPNPDAALDISTPTKGLLMPRVALTATNSPAPLSANVEGMTVYNTATAGTAPNDVTPGYYFNDGTQWVKVADASLVGTDPDITDDAWVDDPANTRIHLGTLSDGTTARPAGTEFVALDNGNVGIGTTAPTAHLDVLKSNGFNAVNVRNNTPNSRVKGTTSFINETLTSNGTFFNTAGHMESNPNISAGVTNNGYSVGTFGGMIRGLAPGDAGNLLDGMAMYQLYGHFGSTASITTTNLYGIRLLPYTRTGTITNKYDIFIGADNGAGATITNNWSFYNNNLANSYFRGNVGIGTATPTNRLHVTAASNPLRLEGLQAGAAADMLLTSDATGVVRQVSMASVSSSSAIRTESANYAVAADDATILVNAAGGAVTVTLPAPVMGKKYVVKKIDASVNNMVIATSGGATIDGAATRTTSVPYQTFVLQNDGTNWFIIN